MGPDPITRRAFCWKAGLAIAALPLAGIGCAAAPVFRGALSGGRLAIPRERLAPEAEELDALLVRVADVADPILLVRRGPGTFVALSARCTHQGCHVRPARGFLVCPCHGSTFGPEGEVVRGPAQAPLLRYPVEVTDRGIEIVVQ